MDILHLTGKKIHTCIYSEMSKSLESCEMMSSHSVQVFQQGAARGARWHSKDDLGNLSSFPSWQQKSSDFSYKKSELKRGLRNNQVSNLVFFICLFVFNLENPRSRKEQTTDLTKAKAHVQIWPFLWHQPPMEGMERPLRWALARGGPTWRGPRTAVISIPASCQWSTTEKTS